MSDDEIQVERSSQDEMARRLFISLREGDKVALVISKKELDALISALHGEDNLTVIRNLDIERKLSKDLRRFRKEAFG